MTDIRKDLLPCPFCGTETVYLNPEKDGGINCPHCLVRMPNECCDIVELVNTWNTRAHDVDGLIAEIEAIDNGIAMPLVSRSHVISAIRKRFGKE